MQTYHALRKWEFSVRIVRVHGGNKTESILINKLDLDTQWRVDYRELLERMHGIKNWDRLSMTRDGAGRKNYKISNM